SHQVKQQSLSHESGELVPRGQKHNLGRCVRAAARTLPRSAFQYAEPRVVVEYILALWRPNSAYGAKAASQLRVRVQHLVALNGCVPSRHAGPSQSNRKGSRATSSLQEQLGYHHSPTKD